MGDQSVVDCRSCVGRFNVVQPQSFTAGFVTPSAPGNLNDMINRIQAAGSSSEQLESLGNVLRGSGDPLTADDTSKCFSESVFECPGVSEQDYEKMVNVK